MATGLPANISGAPRAGRWPGLTACAGPVGGSSLARARSVRSTEPRLAATGTGPVRTVRSRRLPTATRRVRNSAATAARSARVAPAVTGVVAIRVRVIRLRLHPSRCHRSQEACEQQSEHGHGGTIFADWTNELPIWFREYSLDSKNPSGIGSVESHLGASACRRPANATPTFPIRAADQLVNCRRSPPGTHCECVRGRAGLAD